MAGDILTVFCPVCGTLMLVRDAMADRCCQTPRRADCPLPVRIEPGEMQPDGSMAAFDAGRKVGDGT